MEYAILMRGDDEDWGWYMNGYLVALRVDPDEEALFSQKVTAVTHEKDKVPIGTNVDCNQFTYPKWAQFTWWLERKVNEYKIRYALFNNSITGY
jgi:hypothetical protein